MVTGDTPHFRRRRPRGAALFSVVVAALWTLGVYHVTGINPNVNWLPQVLVAGIGEEIVMCGVLFRIVEEGCGTWIAVAVSALLFGGAHIFNPGATLWSAAAIAIEAGGMWPCCTRHPFAVGVHGLHAGWHICRARCTASRSPVGRVMAG